jgi:hypothetical protein
MIKIHYDVLDEDEFRFLKKECETFVAEEVPTEKNYYHRKFISENIVFCFYDKILNELYNKNIKYHITGIGINKINTESNKNDKYHQDSSDLTILIFLNNNFEGGEFEYLDENNNNFKIIPEENKAIVMDSKLYHRVLPVSFGERFTLVCFFKIDEKQNKSLI